MGRDGTRHLRIERGQAHTLEGVVAGLLLLSSLVFALQVTTVTPLSASTSSQHIENQQRAIGEGILSSAAEDESLKTAILFWNESTGSGDGFHGEEAARGYSTGPPNEFGALLNQSLRAHGIAFNVDLKFIGTTGSQDSRVYINQGYPSDNAVTVTRTVVVTNDDPLYDAQGNPTSTTVGNASDLYMPDADPDGPLYNVVTMEVTIWRI